MIIRVTGIKACSVLAQSTASEFLCARARSDLDAHAEIWYSPGPARSPRVYQSGDPRAASATAFARSTSSFAQSSTSIDRQLASDFRTHASVHPSGLNQSYTSLPGAGSRNPFGNGSNSSLSLGRYASSVSVSGPTTPYNHPYAQAVAAGNGVGRKQVVHHTQQLPSIHDISKDWDSGQDVHMDGVNPTYRVVSRHVTQSVRDRTDLLNARPGDRTLLMAEMDIQRSRPLHTSPLSLTAGPRANEPSVP